MGSPGTGRRLDAAKRSFMERRFGQDFSGVRIHTDAAAGEAARGLQAEAFTVGRDIYFGAGRYRPQTKGGQRLLAHELTHTVQQRGISGGGTADAGVQMSGQVTPVWHSSEREAERISRQVVEGTSPVGAISSLGVDQVQRLELPSWEDVEQAGASAVEAVGEAAEAVGETVGEAAEAVGEGAGEVVEAVGGAVDWLATTAGQAALDSANALAGLFGGSVIIRRGCLIVTIPNIPLFPTFQKTLGETPPIGFFIPFASGGTLVGPFPVAGMVGALGYAQLSAEAAVGPGVLRNIRVEICPFSGRYLGTAQLYAAAAIGPRLTLFGGLFAAGGVLIPTAPPIPIIAIIEGGLRGIGTGWLIGAVQDTVTVAYSGGGLSFSNVTDLMGGVLLQGDLQLFAALRLYDRIICQYAHPLGHWETGSAMRLTIPISASLSGTTGTGSVGPITWGPMPIGDIETAIRPLPTGWSCLSWAEIKQIFCDNGVLPPSMCPMPSLPPGGKPPGGGALPPGGTTTRPNPVNVRNGPAHAPIDSGDRVGMSIAITISSSSGRDADMAAILDSEQVGLSYNHTGSMVGVPPLPSSQSGFMPGYPIPDDQHSWSKTAIIDRADNHGGNGGFEKQQLDIYKDPAGGVTTPGAIPASGYIIKRVIQKKGTSISFRTEKRGVAVSVNGYSTSAGPSPTQAEDVVVRP